MRACHLITIVLALLSVNFTARAGACLTTLPIDRSFIPPKPYGSVPGHGMFWYGTDELWTAVGLEGVWHLKNNSDKDGGYFTKLVYWRKGFDWWKEPEPKLIVTARRIDGDSPPVAVSHANPVFVTTNTPAMMTGLRIPTRGCWEVTAFYENRTLAFVVSVEP